MTSSEPRAGGPTPRRSFTPAQKLELIAQYQVACTRREGGAFLREQDPYSSQITESRKLRDVGVLQAKKTGTQVWKFSPEQAEIACLRRQFEVGGEPVEMIRGSTWRDGKFTQALGDSLRGHRRQAEIRETLRGAPTETWMI